MQNALAMHHVTQASNSEEIIWGRRLGAELRRGFWWGGLGATIF